MLAHSAFKEAEVPIIVTFDVQRPTSLELNRIRSFFERLAWEHLGNTAYRYPRLDGQPAPKDWFNHVIPALMLLRTFARHTATTGRNFTKFIIDVQSSTGFNPRTNVGVPPLAAHQISFTQPTHSTQSFGLQNLEDWIDGVTWPYPPPPPAAGAAGT
jgi:hypothetical protein